MSEAATPLRDDRLSALTEGLAPNDPFTRCWLTHVNLRMRRELSWLWRNRAPIDWVAESLERHATAEVRRKFFEENAAASYLNERIRETDMPLGARPGARGSFRWLAGELNLSRAEIFVVALALAAARDAATGNVISTLLGDSRRQAPTLGLAQWLWDDPGAFARLTSPAHPLFARAVLRRGEGRSEWDAPLSMPGLIASALEGEWQDAALELKKIAEPPAKLLRPDPPVAVSHDLELDLLAQRMARAPEAMRVVPVSLAFAQSSLDSGRAAPVLQQIAARTGRPVYAVSANVAISDAVLEHAGCCCWLMGADLLIPSYDAQSPVGWQNTLRPFPIYVFAAAAEEAAPVSVNMLPPLKIYALDYLERRQAWERELRAHKLAADASAVRECAYRFRLDATAIAEVVEALSDAASPVTVERMLAACQQQVGLLIGSQATLVAPRFGRAELVLDQERGAQFDQLLAAMKNLSRVHADWGTGRVWADSGISALFAGPPGTGKTMAAEVLAAELRLPLYHVDLSQVVNKYIGETEKNLRKLFDAAEQADIVLFFDEAESLFGQRMQARSSNDRFANLEISYLLERMDRFRGLAILATNRRKDLDEAFLRRLRYVIEFPLPAESERFAIWKLSVPSQIASDGVDFGFLAREFALPGGNIRSIVLNACLQAASSRQKPALDMSTLMEAIDREYEKLGRPLSREQKIQLQLMGAGSRGTRRLDAQTTGASR